MYDTTKKVWVTSFFANAGQTFNIAVFSDAFHTSQQYQFDTNSSGAAYVYLQNVATSGQYVMFIESTGVNTYCAYMAPSGSAALPAPSPRPTGGANGNNLLCDTSKANVTGVSAPGGNLSLTWALDSSLEAGVYTVGIYDQNANAGVGAVLGTVQVSLTSGGASLLTTGSTTGMNSSPAPFGATGTNILAWNSTTDQSVGGIVATTSEVIPGLPTTYRWTLTDPDGQVLSAPAPVTLPSNNTLSNTFAFSALTMNPPGQYPSSIFGVQLYDTTSGTNHVIASQAMQIVGYHLSTQFIQGGVTESQINFSATGTVQNVTADIKFTNDGNVYFGTGDSLSGIEFTESKYTVFSASFKPPGTYGGGGVFGGVTWALSTAAAGEDCKSAAGCSKSVTDSNGGLWTVTNYCSVQPSSGPGVTDQCIMTVLPTSAGTTLPPGASIDIPSVIWYADAKSSWACYSTPCFATTTILPTHGLSWSQTNNLASPTAWTPVAFGAVDTGLTLAGTMRFDYAGSRGISGATCTGAPGSVNATQGGVPWLEGHFFNPAFTRGDYQVSTPFALSAARCDVGSFLITNNSSTGNTSLAGASGFPEIAITFPSYFTTSQITVDSNSTANWTKLACPAAFGSTTVCFNGPTIARSTSSTLYLDIPLTIASFGFQEMSVQAFSTDLVYFPLTADGSTVTAYDYQTFPTYSADSLAIASFSLNANLMTSAFTPSTVGSGQNPTPLTLVVGNTSTAADPNPDAIDEFVLEQTTSKNWTINGTPTVTGPTGWLNRATFNPSGNTMDYYFGVCAAQAVQSKGPPQTTGTVVPLTGSYPSPPPCTNAQEQNSLLPGQSATVTMNLTTAGGIAAGSYPFTVYAHGANSGGWSALKTFSLTVNAESSSSGFQSVGTTCPGTAVGTNSLPMVSTNSNCFVYSLKNTSASASIAKVDITLPAFDQSGLAANSWALTGSPITTNIKVGTISGGVFTLVGAPAGCTVNAGNTSNPVGGSTNGQIEISGCTGLTAGKTLAVEFQATSPGSQSDTYDFPSTTDGITSSAAWIGDQSVQESFAVGLTVVVDPSNPGPGGSTPIVSCTTCAFSGSTIDFGAVAASSNVVGTDVVRATVIYTGANTGTMWQLSIGVSGTNPACVGASCGGILNELLTSVDNTIANGGHSNTNCGGSPTATLSPQQLTLAAVPSSGSPLLISKGSETACTSGQAPDWDTIQNYKVQVGTEAAVGHSLTIIYTLVP